MDAGTLPDGTSLKVQGAPLSPGWHHSGSTAAPRPTLIGCIRAMCRREGTAFASAPQEAGRDAESIHVPGYNHLEINEAPGCAGTVPHAAAVPSRGVSSLAQLFAHDA